MSFHESDTTLNNSDFLSSSSLYDTSHMQPQLVIANFTRASATRSYKSRQKTSSPKQAAIKTRHSQVQASRVLPTCSSRLDDELASDLARVDLLAVNARASGKRRAARYARGKERTIRSSKSDPSCSSFSPSCDYPNRVSNVSSSTNSVYTSSEDLSDN